MFMYFCFCGTIHAMKKECSRCSSALESHRVGKYRYCLACHAKNMRLNRPRHVELSKEQRERANARSYANVYIKRGKIKKENCFICNSEKSQMHHKDYKKPIDILWLCRECHLRLHSEE